MSLYKMLIITEISNEKTTELAIYGVLCRDVATFYPQELRSLCQTQEKLKPCRSSKIHFSNNCFIADGIHVKIHFQQT